MHSSDGHFLPSYPFLVQTVAMVTRRDRRLLMMQDDASLVATNHDEQQQQQLESGFDKPAHPSVRSAALLIESRLSPLLMFAMRPDPANLAQFLSGTVYR